MKILIATGIYPPDIGGPAQYAASVEKVWKSWGERVYVKTFRFERVLPTGLRHVFYFLKCLPAALRADFIFILDTFSAAVPAVFTASLLRKKSIIRTGGDFLWESYVERTGDLVLFRDFYKTRMEKFSRKEQLIFRLTRFALRRASAVIFSTTWQRDIFAEAYSLNASKIFVVENYYGPKEVSFPPAKKNFVAGARPLKWKNKVRLAEAFKKVLSKDGALVFDDATAPHEVFLERISRAYALILVSLGDISPNFITDAIRYNKPFIVSKESGLYERIKNCALFVNPESVDDMAEKILWLADPFHYEEQKKKVEAFSFTHSWEAIGQEILKVYHSLK